MKRLLLSVLIVLFFIGGLKAQRKGGMGLIDRSQESDNYLTISLGPDYCFADTKESPFSQSILKNWDLSVGFRKTFANNWGYKAGLGYAEYSGTDGPTFGASSISPRGFSFTSNILQMSLQAEYNIKIGPIYYNKQTANSIYLFLGAGILASDANLVKQTSRNFTYKPINITTFIPLGVGYHYNFNNGFVVGAEIKFKLPFSDYIDGFDPSKTRGSINNDMMEGFAFTFSYLLGMEYLKRQ